MCCSDWFSCCQAAWNQKDHISLTLERIPNLMCGIVGYVGPAGSDVTTILLDGLTKLEYRGYDSAGIAVLTSTVPLQLHRRPGKISNLLPVIPNGSHPPPR